MRAHSVITVEEATTKITKSASSALAAFTETAASRPGPQVEEAPPFPSFACVVDITSRTALTHKRYAALESLVGCHYRGRL